VSGSIEDGERVRQHMVKVFAQLRILKERQRAREKPSPRSDTSLVEIDEDTSCSIGVLKRPHRPRRGAAPRRAGRGPRRSAFWSNAGTVTRKRTDLDQRAYELRQQGLTYRAIAKWLGVTLAMARRRVLRHERTLREAAKPTDRPHSSQPGESS
jgi:hypothetical protein